jgi:hypothetical protein
MRIHHRVQKFPTDDPIFNQQNHFLASHPVYPNHFLILLSHLRLVSKGVARLFWFRKTSVIWKQQNKIPGHPYQENVDL